ncbi:MAG: carbonic anhydrase family protein [Paenibacillus sp.]|jgi:carbonic anhydrase|uniref:carbonic anhydrase n=1 Tax=Paenibacillus sp. TaxID=58172 RepID=UPI00290D69BA|nr:carbonic anhydrase family protein [Paenibacillus sp.]MDU4698169.1 carbonic anhydrase family protein [Paenibacillus sp.]
MKRRWIMLGIMSLILLTGASSIQAVAPSARGEIVQPEEIHFSYDHQEEWEFVSGKLQSPIDIDTSKVVDYLGSGLELNYEQIGTYVENNGHSIQVGLRGTAEIDDREFSVSQVHFHSPSEHTLDGKHFPLEGHFVHLAQNGRIAVIGVMFTVGNHNDAFQQILDAAKLLPKEQGGVKIDHLKLTRLLPHPFSYYHYLGSLTTPPLTENVEWYILTHSVQISREQLKEFHKYYNQNNRHIQALNDRKVFKWE